MRYELTTLETYSDEALVAINAERAGGYKNSLSLAQSDFEI